MNKKIGILGGTFDPPHIGHLIIANEILYELSLDEIWFMPNDNPPHKEKTVGVSNEDRVRMLQLCLNNHPRFRIETIELNRSGKSYTYDTMKILTAQYPENEFYFIIGADMIEYLPNWYNIDELFQLVTFVGVERPTFKSGSNYPLLRIDIPEINISSTDIRERLQNRRPVKYLLNDDVISYIKENNLYGS